MKNITPVATNPAVGNRTETDKQPMPIGGLSVRTDLRAGLAWDDLDSNAQELWSSLTSAMSNLTGGADTSS